MDIQLSFTQVYDTIAIKGKRQVYRYWKKESLGTLGGSNSQLTT
jgi:hypothetical protein